MAELLERKSDLQSRRRSVQTEILCTGYVPLSFRSRFARRPPTRLHRIRHLFQI